MVNRMRCLHGNRVIHKDDFARGLIASMRAGRDGGDIDGYEYDSAAGDICAVLRGGGLYGGGDGEGGAEDGSGGGAGISAVG